MNAHLSSFREEACCEGEQEKGRLSYRLASTLAGEGGRRTSPIYGMILQPRLRKMVILSLIIHVVMLSIIYHLSRTRESFFIAPVYTVDLVSMPTPLTEKVLGEEKMVAKGEEKESPSKTIITPKQPKVVLKKEKIDTLQKQVRKEKTIETPIKKPIIEEDKVFIPSKKRGETVEREITEKSSLKESLKQEIKENEGIKEVEPKGTISLEAIAKTLKKLEETVKEGFGKTGKENGLEEELGRLENIFSDKDLGKKKERREAPEKNKKPIDRGGDKGDILKETDKEIKEAFKKLKEGETARVEEVKKEVSKGGREIDLPSYKPIEWDVELKGEKGVVLVGTKGGKVDNRLLDVEFKAYYEEIWERVQSSWILPKNIPNDSVRAAIIAISIKRGGEILTIKTERSSGNSLFDRSAIRAIEKVNPLPPLPEGYSGDILEVGLRFCPPWLDSCEEDRP